MEDPDCVPGSITYYLGPWGKLYNLSGPHVLSSSIHVQSILGKRLKNQISEGNPKH